MEKDSDENIFSSVIGKSFNFIENTHVGNVLLYGAILLGIHYLYTNDLFGKKNLNPPPYSKVKFKNLAGSIPKEIVQLKDMFENSEKYEKYNLTIPKGILFTGPTGTGKTLLAKAIAGELECPFISQNGSDFVELYIGSGPLRVRELFKEAKALAKKDENKRCIIFIDELDAVGEKRSATDSHREYNSTLNCLLSEMDGFSSNVVFHSAWDRFFSWVKGGHLPKYQLLNIMVIGTTNREDILDKALLRPGRFDHIIEIALPDQEKRYLILKQYLEMYPLKSKINVVELSRATEGMNCADLASIVKTAAKNAILNNDSGITEENIKEALEKIINLKKKHLEFEFN